MWQTFGHEGVKNILTKQISSGKFPHTYLFAGIEGVGKKTLALEFAGHVLNLSSEHTQNELARHPDFQILDAGNGEITVEMAQDFISRLAFKPFLAAKKVAVINNAHNLNTQSSNALLKTLEEPSPSTIIILIADKNGLLPTITSRCQIFYFNTFSENQLQEFAGLRGLPLEKNLIDLSFGRISQLLKFAADKESLIKQALGVKNYEKFSEMSIGDRILCINEYADMEEKDLEQNLSLWLNWQVKNLPFKPKNYTKLQALTDSLLGLKQNKNKKLLLQSLFLKI